LGLELSIDYVFIERVHFIVLNRARGFSPGDSSILSLLGFNEKEGGNRTAPNCIPIKGSKDLGLFRAW
jgi:hypothetical protein